MRNGETRFAYDSLDRLSARNGKNFTYGGNSLDLVSDGESRFSRGTDGSLLALGQGDQKRLTVNDGHGDLVGGFDPAGSLQTLTDSAAFDPFGQAIASAGSKRSLGFQGDYTDPASGEVDMGARWYSPGAGGFTTRDSISLPSSPSGLANRYAYGLGAPTNFSDPDGHCPEGYTSYLYGADQRCVRSKSAPGPCQLSCPKPFSSFFTDLWSRHQMVLDYLKGTFGNLPAGNNPGGNDHGTTPTKNNTGGVGVYRPGPSPTQAARDAAASAARNNPLPQVAAATAPIFAGSAGDSMSPPVSSSPNAPAQQVSDNKVADQQESIKKDVDKVTGGEPVIKSVGEPKEVGFWEWVDHKVSSIDWSEVGHTILDVVGMIPVVGEIADGINALWYLAEGDYLNAALSAAALVPSAGAAATGAKLIGKGLRKYGDEAVSVAATAAGCVRPNSFVAGTPVLMADGSTKPIEDVKSGDVVQSADPTTGTAGPREVTEVRDKSSWRTLVTVTVDVDGPNGTSTEVITSTDEHPFWVDGEVGTWRNAVDLKPGDSLVTADGSKFAVVSTTTRTEYRKVYNLTVDGLHTYYVLAGSVPILVHNTGRQQQACQLPLFVLKDGEGSTAKQIADSLVNGGSRQGQATKRAEKLAEANGNYQCWRCGQRTENPDNMHLGHRNVPTRKGGNLEDVNVCLEGAACNLSAGARGYVKPRRSCAERGSCGASYKRDDWLECRRP